ncbi:hypothetical protein NDU88_007332 [Pleurodeles waltl]|uniref:Uncharacterized protein n=1 Tax=Pleurodeles waltl TaxID=8319 RepID=A0AAV7QPG2_PLEWA|nr:hypothetical protein NDU88_007332 [Pleurodeles waltl]
MPLPAQKPGRRPPRAAAPAPSQDAETRALEKRPSDGPDSPSPRLLDHLCCGGRGAAEFTQFARVLFKHLNYLTTLRAEIITRYVQRYEAAELR